MKWLLKPRRQDTYLYLARFLKSREHKIEEKYRKKRTGENGTSVRSRIQCEGYNNMQDTQSIQNNIYCNRLHTLLCSGPVANTCKEANRGGIVVDQERIMQT